MSNVIGPIGFEDWYTMRQLREDVKYMRSKASPKYNSAIEKETDYYNNLRGQYV